MTTSCACINKMDAAMAAHGSNAKIALPIIGPRRPLIETEPVVKRRGHRAPAVFASFCPFCGTKYPEDE